MEIEFNEVISELLQKYYPTDERFIKEYTYNSAEGLDKVIDFSKNLCEKSEVVKIVDYYDAGFTVLGCEGFPQYWSLLLFFIKPSERTAELKKEMFDDAKKYAESHGKILMAHCFNKNKPIIRFYSSLAKHSFPGKALTEPTTYFCF